MSENTPNTFIRFAAWFPFACLALSAAAFGLRARARIARGFHLASVSTTLSADSAR